MYYYPEGGMIHWNRTYNQQKMNGFSEIKAVISDKASFRSNISNTLMIFISENGVRTFKKLLGT